jgi:hypothetical protein
MAYRLGHGFDIAAATKENMAGDVLASLTTTLWNVPFKVWTGGATMADATLNRRMAVRLGPGVTFAPIGIFGFNGQIDFEALRPYGPPEKTPAGHRQAAHLSQRLRAEGVPMFDFRTTTQNLAPAINELDAAMRSSRLRHDGNPVLGWCVGNVVGRPDRRGDLYPAKQRPEQKIDAAAALMMAVGAADGCPGAGRQHPQSRRAMDGMAECGSRAAARHAPTTIGRW